VAELLAVGAGADAGLVDAARVVLELAQNVSLSVPLSH
jgi:hypothetical protein